MAKLRIFVSSTYYDLKHARASIQTLIESMGHEAILSERGHVSYHPDKTLDESCYAEIKSADIVVLIIGGRYGTEASSHDNQMPNDPNSEETYREYDSITRREHKAALDNNVPVYTLIERAVDSEYWTYLKNRESVSIKYAHVDSVNIFKFIDSIRNLPAGNVIQTFDRITEAEAWLKDQWSSLFRDLLKNRSNDASVITLEGQVSRLGELGKTLETYLENVLNKIEPEKAAEIIAKEQERRRLESRSAAIRERVLSYLSDKFAVDPEMILGILESSSTLEEFVTELERETAAPLPVIASILRNPHVLRDLQRVRVEITERPFPDEPDFSARAMAEAKSRIGHTVPVDWRKSPTSSEGESGSR